MNRRLFFWSALLCGLGLALLLFAYRSPISLRTKANSPPSGLPASSNTLQPQEISREDAANATLGSGPVLRGRQGTSSSLTPAVTEPSAQLRDLVTRLTDIGTTNGPITPEQAQAWTNTLADLAAQGPAAVPAIREFLAKNEEIDFQKIRGGVLLGQPSLRVALIKTLNQIGGPEAQELMVQTLGTTAIPLEVALLANFLDQQAAGKYHNEVLKAAGEVLNMAAQGQLTGRDIGPLLLLSCNLDPATAQQTAEKLAPQYGMYSAIMLASLEGGVGLPSILRAIDNPGENGASGSELAFQMLAQVAAQSPEASASLLQRARAGQISDAAWLKIATGLGGDQFGMYGLSPDGQPAIPNLPGLKLYHMDIANQNFYSAPVSAIASPDQLEQRRQLIDQLLATNPDAFVQQALKQAQARLSGRLARN